jgi:quinol monooxygenase YgiN
MGESSHGRSNPAKGTTCVFAVIARFQVKPGHVDEVITFLNQAAVPSRQEPGCHLYIANQDLADANVITMYEVYDDPAAFQDHLDSEHFQEIVAGRVVPLLESRRRDTFTVVTPLQMTV